MYCYIQVQYPCICAGGGHDGGDVGDLCYSYDEVILLFLHAN